MSNWHATIVKTLNNRRTHRSIAAIASLASALSVMVGVLASYYTPKGLGRVSMALHMTKKPFILKLAPIITGCSLTIATVTGLLGFYLWVLDPPDDSVAKAEASSDS
jgi:hypothetical protein